MRCPRCFGMGVCSYSLVTPSGFVVGDCRETCPTCNGYGIIHCCEGDREQERPVSPPAQLASEGQPTHCPPPTS
jgi:hypothetical protein